MARFARLLAAACLVAFTGLATSVTVQPVNPNELIILTTTTTQDSGILSVLTDAFAKTSGLAVKAIVAGSGRRPGWPKAMAPRRLVMYNDFVTSYLP
jgi:ABC-type tungstate transport system permease subunit